MRMTFFKKAGYEVSGMRCEAWGMGYGANNYKL